MTRVEGLETQRASSSESSSIFGTNVLLDSSSVDLYLTLIQSFIIRMFLSRRNANHFYSTLHSISSHRIFSSAHGAGEAIRGTFNDSIDQAGEGIAGAGSSEKEKAERQANLATKDSGNEDSGKVVNKGVQEVKDGLNQIGSTTK